MSENPQKNSQESDQIDEKATERSALNPAVVEKSQTDAQGKAEIENKRTNKHDGSAGGEGPSITIEAIDEHGRKREVSRTVLGTEKDLLPTESEIDLTSTEQDSREDILASGTIGAMARENPVASAGKSMLEATKDPKVRESIKRDLTDVIRNAHQGQAEAQDENFAGGTFKIPDAAQQESRLAEAVQKILQAEIEMTSPAGEQNESDFPIEQALWRVFHPQGSELSDGEIKLFRTAVTEAAGLFVDKVHGDIESFFEENKAKVALALAGATINTGVAIEASKDGATAAGVPAAAAGVVAILKYLADQLKPSSGIPNSPNIEVPENESTPSTELVPSEKPYKPLQEKLKDFQDSVKRLSENPAEAIEEFSLKVDAWDAVENKIVSNPSAHQVPEHVVRLTEQMESSNIIDLAKGAEKTKFVFPGSIQSLTEYTNLPADIRNVASEMIPGTRFSNEFASGITVFSEITSQNYIIVPASTRDFLTGQLVANGDVESHLRHEMGHILKEKYGWEQDLPVRQSIYDGQKNLECDLLTVYEKFDRGESLTPEERILTRFQRYTFDLRTDLSEGERQAQRLRGAEEILCDLYQVDQGRPTTETDFSRQLRHYFGDTLDYLKSKNWKRPSDPTGIRKLFGVEE